jgi:hypothetical protein
MPRSLQLKTYVGRPGDLSYLVLGSLNFHTSQEPVTAHALQEAPVESNFADWAPRSGIDDVPKNQRRLKFGFIDWHDLPSNDPTPSCPSFSSMRSTTLLSLCFSIFSLLFVTTEDDEEFLIHQARPRDH